MDHEGRQARLRARIAGEGVDALSVTGLANVRYLCGFSGSSGSLLVDAAGAWFLTDGRYRTQSAEEVEGAQIEVYTVPEEQGASLRKAAEVLGVWRVAYEADHVTFSGLEKLSTWFEARELVPSTGWVEELRQVKDAEELTLVRAAAELADEGFAFILQQVEPGKSERELALELEVHMRRRGADGVSFPPIVAAAERSALPHAQPTNRVVEKGRYLLLDLGCIYRGYCSDLTRTVVVGPADDRHREIYEVVAEAQRAGLAALRAGRTGAEVDSAARDVMAAAALGDAFPHGLGHGVGLEIHEAPVLRRTSTDALHAGNVVTVEPGIYLPGWGGVRIEDLVLVTEDGAEVLSRSPKDLVVL